MRLLVRKEAGQRADRFHSWSEYKSRGYAYPDSPEVHDDDLLFYDEELLSKKPAEPKLVEVPCPTCWGQRAFARIVRTPEGTVYVRERCGTCLGSGLRIIIES